MRVLKIAGAYCLACVASAQAFGIILFLPTIVVTLAQGDLADGKKFSWFFVFYQGLLGFYVAMVFAGLALVPATLAIIYAEAKRLRSATFYVATGLVIATVCFGVVQVARGNLKISDVSFASDRTTGIALLMLYLCVVGLIGGLVYWLIAGRSAGAWRVPAGGQPERASASSRRSA